MFLQGDLQKVFDALYDLGVIDPVLEMDWVEEMKGIGSFGQELNQAVQIANQFQKSSQDLVSRLGKFDEKVLSYLAMEVAREFADFHSCDQLH